MIATVFVYQRTAEEAFFPIAVMVHTIPVMAYAPILVLLLGNGLSAKVATAALGLTVRTLQRQLAEADMSFTDVVDSVRRDLAVRYLESLDCPITRVAELLGYSTPGSFTRWFTAQFGMAPIRWRARHQHAADRG